MCINHVTIETVLLLHVLKIWTHYNADSILPNKLRWVNFNKLSIHRSIHLPPLIQGQVMGAAAGADKPRCPCPQPLCPALLGISWGVPRPAERHSSCSVSWIFPGASFQCDMDRTSNMGGILTSYPSHLIWLLGWRNSGSTPSSSPFKYISNEIILDFNYILDAGWLKERGHSFMLKRVNTYIKNKNIVT